MLRIGWVKVAVLAVLALAGCTTEAAPTGEPGGTPTAGAERFDPLTSRLHVPDVAGLHRTEHATSAELERVLLSDLTLAGETKLAEVVVRPRGHGRPNGDATEPVQGQPAYWVNGATAVRQSAGVRLAFTWAEDSWVYVGAAAGPSSATTTDALRELARTVAEAIEFTAPERVPLPFTVAADLPGLRDSVEPTGTHRMWSFRRPPSEPYVRASLQLTDRDTEPRNGAHSIAAVSDGEHSYKPGTGNGIVNGRRAYDSGSGTVIVFEHADGFTVEITGPGGADLMTLAGAVTIVEGAADEAHWTGNYLLS